MKKKSVGTIGIIYSSLLIILSLAMFGMGTIEEIATGVFLLPIGILMLAGSIGFQKGKTFGKVLLVISGVLAAPLGLILVVLALTSKE